MGINRQTNALEPLDFNHLVSNLPEMKYLSTKVDVYQFENPIDSSDMAPEVWTRLVGIIANRYQAYDGFMEQTQWPIQPQLSHLCLRI